jgi:hypothetical protein
MLKLAPWKHPDLLAALAQLLPLPQASFSGRGVSLSSKKRKEKN